MNQPLSARRSSGGARGLPGHYYNSREIFALETERIFSRCWHYVDRADRLRGVGHFQTDCIDDRPLLIVQNGEESAGCFANVCRHRGAIVAAQAQGQFAGRAITCPYHGWAYDVCGKLVGAPNMREVTGFEKSKYGLRQFHCADWNGFRFVSFADVAQPLEMELQPVADKLLPWSLQCLIVGDTIEYQVRANWKLLFQNYNECYHCPSVHPALNQLTPYKQSSNDLCEGPILGGPMQLAEGKETISTSGRKVAAPFPGLDPARVRQVFYYTIFPTMFISAHPDYVMVHRIRRLDVDRTHVKCEFLLHPAQSSPDLQGAVQLWDTTNRQDWEVCQSAQRGARSRDYRPGPYSNMESTLAAFDQHYRAEIGELPT